MLKPRNNAPPFCTLPLVYALNELIQRFLTKQYETQNFDFRNLAHSKFPKPFLDQSGPIATGLGNPGGTLYMINYAPIGKKNYKKCHPTFATEKVSFSNRI